VGCGGGAIGRHQAATERGILLAPGDCFDAPSHFRLGFAAAGETHRTWKTHPVTLRRKPQNPRAGWLERFPDYALVSPVKIKACSDIL